MDYLLKARVQAAHIAHVQADGTNGHSARDEWRHCTHEECQDVHQALATSGTQKRRTKGTMTMATGFSINPSGVWTAAQVDRVLAVLQPEADRMGLSLQKIEATVHGWEPRYLIAVMCKRHQIPVALNTACAVCLQEQS